MDGIELGRRGEEEAARHLARRGWEILGQNVRVGRRELDLIVFRRGILAFVEVKSRRGLRFGLPEEAISHRKRRDIALAAGAWLRANRVAGVVESRFDAVGVLWRPNSEPIVRHVPDAWRMG